VRVAGQKNPAPQVLERRALHDALHQPLAQPASAMRFQNEHVAKISDGGKVGDDAGKTNLRARVVIDSEA